jgi:hypothetical protein
VFFVNLRALPTGYTRAWAFLVTVIQNLICNLKEFTGKVGLELLKSIVCHSVLAEPHFPLCMPWRDTLFALSSLLTSLAGARVLQSKVDNYLVPPGFASASTEHRVPSEVDLSGYARRDCDDHGCTILFERPMYHLTPLR